MKPAVNYMNWSLLAVTRRTGTPSFIYSLKCKYHSWLELMISASTLCSDSSFLAFQKYNNNEVIWFVPKSSK